MTPTAAGPPDLAVQAAVAGHLARYKGVSRNHTYADLRMYLAWCASRGLSVLAVRRVDVQRCVRWLQEARQLQPSTVSRRLSVPNVYDF